MIHNSEYNVIYILFVPAVRKWHFSAIHKQLPFGDRRKSINEQQLVEFHDD